MISIRILAAACTLLLFFGILGRPHFQDMCANRAACRLADDICEFREQNSAWPRALSELPGNVATEYKGATMQYDSTALTVTVPVAIVNRHLVRNLWSRIIRSGFSSQTRTSSITIYIMPRYQFRRGH